MLVVLLLSGGAAAAASPLTAADLAWARRGEGARGDLADPQAAARAVAAYEAVVTKRPRDLEAIWKLQRALHFQGEYTRIGARVRERLWERGTELAERAMTELHGSAAWADADPEEVAAGIEVDRTTAAAVHFWAAVHWGLWGETKGPLPAVRKGIAKRIRDHARVAVALDETYERAGPHRLLGRLHAVAPRVPLFTGWIDRELAIEHLARAVELAPEDPYNQIYLAEARLEWRPQDRAAALAALEAIVEAEPPPPHAVEEIRARSQARALLERARM